MQKFNFKTNIAILSLAILLSACVNTGRYNTQKGAAIGAGIGAIAGQAIGRDTGSTLIGAGVGTLIGSILGNAEDQQADQFRDVSTQQQLNQAQNRYTVPAPQQYQTPQPYYSAPAPEAEQAPPGRWITVPGRWQGNRWIPPHREWRPVQPEYSQQRHHRRYRHYD